MKVVLCVLMAAAAAALVSARPQGPGFGSQPQADYSSQVSGGYGGEENYPPAKYEFQWEVKDAESGNDYAHQETRDGDSVQGEYHVLLPDGRVLRVTYTVTRDQGYVADVQFEGEAQPYQGAGGQPGQDYQGFQQGKK